MRQRLVRLALPLINTVATRPPRSHLPPPLCASMVGLHRGSEAAAIVAIGRRGRRLLPRCTKVR